MAAHPNLCRTRYKMKKKVMTSFCTVYGPNEVQLSTVCVTKFNSGMELVKNTRESGRPKTVTVPKIIKRWKILKN